MDDQEISLLLLKLDSIFKRKGLHYTTFIKRFPLLPHASVSDTDWFCPPVASKTSKINLFQKLITTFFAGDIEYFLDQGEQDYLKNSFKYQPEKWDYEDFARAIKKKNKDFLEELTNNYYDRLLSYLSSAVNSPYSSFSRY